ncbi:GAF and ANTAR domain-containing protein [Streptomyces sp. NPDC046716]|uniref:GAF and ANTAR domain-containing protein n=1 Tax=Streptomyces sp. NPDC046716 TaxID=3157093 RepID=UPI003409D464
MVTDMELAALAVRLTDEASAEPLDAGRILAALVEGVRRLVGTLGAGVHYAVPGDGEVRTEGTSTELRALTADAAAWGEGPAHEVRTAGRPLIDVDVTGRPARVRWPRWVPRARALGLARVTALPLSDGGATVGALVLHGGPGPSLGMPALMRARAVGGMAADMLSLVREVERNRSLVAQLDHALTSRVVIEQAKGMLSVRRGVSVDEAFTLLRGYARSHRRKITEIAADITEGRADLHAL